MRTEASDNYKNSSLYFINNYDEESWYYIHYKNIKIL